MKLYLFAGVKTSPNFMERFRAAMHQKLAEEGHTVHSRLLYPYGDWSRNVLVQVREIYHDMRLGFSRMHKSIGGARAMREINEERREGSFVKQPHEPLVLIGHSGGGTAAVHTAFALREEGESPIYVIQIGSPKSRIPTDLAGETLYLYGVGKIRGKMKLDPITRLGTFGGWRAAGQQSWLRWRRDRNGPGHSDSIGILGGHADYFRESEAYVNEAGRSNLELTMEKVWDWLQAKIARS
ncbi:hypothetical protein [Cohnella sp. AR92]|uniref:hypothetical protein n=1 Tax=Cohnella sp. AR92 TaxID=648716 RepID=UPI000F8EEB29|nr:hypothetical protein [Cohnella sp. AR92]RUS47965.1 hypothetical protein ELR57_05365 [Cohnella sp. AR92]